MGQSRVVPIIFVTNKSLLTTITISVNLFKRNLASICISKRGRCISYCQNNDCVPVLRIRWQDCSDVFKGGHVGLKPTERVRFTRGVGLNRRSWCYSLTAWESDSPYWHCQNSVRSASLVSSQVILFPRLRWRTMKDTFLLTANLSRHSAESLCWRYDFCKRCLWYHLHVTSFKAVGFTKVGVISFSGSLFFF